METYLEVSRTKGTLKNDRERSEKTLELHDVMTGKKVVCLFHDFLRIFRHI